MTDLQSRPAAMTRPQAFPVTWERADDARTFWQLERLHFAAPMPLMDFSVMGESHHQLNWAFERYGLPIRYHFRLINHRWYFAILPVEGSPAEHQAMGERGGENVAAAAERLETLWHDEWLPEIKRHLGAWERFDLAGASDEALMPHLDDTVARFRRVWQIHFLQTMPVYVAMSTFEELCRDLFGDRTALGPYRFTQGLGNLTFDGGRALWRLGRRALADRTVRRAMAEREPTEVVAALETSMAGRAFLVDLDEYLREWGKRGGMLGVSHPSWIEDPTPAIKQLQEFVARPDRNVEAEFAARVEGRERAVAEARARLEGYPAPVRARFEEALRTAETATIVSEDHNHLIDYQCTYHVRRVLLEVGARLAAAGVLDTASDVFHLTLDELRDTFAVLPALDRRGMVAARKVRFAAACAMAAPPALGPAPQSPPPTDPLATALGKFFGGPPPPSDEADTIRGHAGSGGRAVGTARVVRTLAEASKLRPGDILVAETTAPAWTPLFASVAAVVTDAGGVLSHSAVVAREYAVPAVVGAAVATGRIRDGQLIEVDGDAGTVRLIGG